MASIGDALALMEEAEERLLRAKELLSQVAAQQGINEWPGGSILADILRAGGAVTRTRLYQIAAQHGMDRRGLGGFFRQSGRTSLYELPGTDKVVLTPYGAEQARRLVDREQSMAYEESKIEVAKIAEASFAEDWDREEDSIYDSA